MLLHHPMTNNSVQFSVKISFKIVGFWMNTGIYLDDTSSFFLTYFKWATEEYFETLACNSHIIRVSLIFGETSV